MNVRTMSRMSLGTALAAAIVTLTGCGSSAGNPDGAAKAPDVASLTTTASAAAPAAEEQRPRLRVDMSEEEEQAMWAGWAACLAEHGDTAYADKLARREIKDVPEDVRNAARKACVPKEPLGFWQEDPKNPEAADIKREVDQCIRSKGVNPDAGAGADPDNLDPGTVADVDKMLTATGKCQKEVYAKHQGVPPPR